MDKLFIEIQISTENAETQIHTTVESFLALYVYRYLGSPTNIKLCFVRSATCVAEDQLQLCSALLRCELTEQDILCQEAASVSAIRDLRLPIYAKDDNTYIAGMCAVCRELVARQPVGELRQLLGFKSSCLQASAEASIWTRYCEVDMVAAINRLNRQLKLCETVDTLPLELVRFEKHMAEPVRMHNIYKLAREQANSKVEGSGKVIIDCSTPKETLAIGHRYAEGVAFTIADLLLYPCMRMLLQHFAPVLEHFPLTSAWLKEVESCAPTCASLLSDLQLQAPIQCSSQQTYSIPEAAATSLYKSDPKRYKPRQRIFTTQSEVDATLNKLANLQLKFSSDSARSFELPRVDWTLLEPHQARNSALPEQRLERKRQQLENLANAVISLAQPGARIVDFCAGTGHLGLLLALQLPQCTVILMENKANSLERAKLRAEQLGLSNLRFYQCNIDYFTGAFDVGTSLHACGTATDIVLQQCRRARAAFVCCPCCYGALQPMPHISYPLSKSFRSVLEERDFLHVAHTADQAHALGTLNCREETTRQGQLCMDIVDTDRKLQAEEGGYEVLLTRLQPEECTPKNRLLVGWPRPLILS